MNRSTDGDVFCCSPFKKKHKADTCQQEEAQWLAKILPRMKNDDGAFMIAIYDGGESVRPTAREGRG